MYRIVLVFSLLGFIAIPYAADAYGHGLGADQALPISFEGMDVTVRTELSPSDITVGEIDDANVQIKFFDTLTNATLNDVLYRIEIWRSGDLLARNTFYDVDGTLDVEVRPVFSCGEVKLWECTDYFGEKHTIAGGLFARGEGRPVIKGPIFDKGGLYNIKTIIESASSPKTLVADPLEFETFVSVAQEQDFLIQTAQAQEVPVIVKTYYDDITSFDYSGEDDSVTFEMPFDWDPEYISQVQVVHEEIRFPKTFDPYANGTSFKGYVNGIEVDNRVLLLDPYSFNDTNILHFLVTGPELERINQQLGPDNHASKKMSFEIVPQGEVVRNSAEFYLVNLDDGARVNSTVNISWDSAYGVNDEIPFDFAFFDESENLLRDVRYAYYVINDDTNETIMSAGTDAGSLGIEASEGIDVQRITIPTQDTYRIDVWILGQGLDFDPTYSGVGSAMIEVGPSSGMVKETATQETEVRLPGWIKTSAQAWSQGVIDDSTFILGIEWLIDNGVIVIPPAEVAGDAASSVPSWVKDTAGAWSAGIIGDEAFVSGIAWLIENGVITV